MTGPVKVKPSRRSSLAHALDAGVHAGRDHHVHLDAVAADALHEIGLRGHADRDPDAAAVRLGQDGVAGGQGEQEKEPPHDAHAAQRP